MAVPAGHLATFVHVSDLHIGQLDPTTGHAKQDAYTAHWIQNIPWCDGYLGHSGIALRQLDVFFHRLQQDERAEVIITGDLTTVGMGIEFDLAHRYLGDISTFSPPLRLGLGQKNYADRTILGNHDHWPGRLAKNAIDFAMLDNRPAPPGHSSVPPPASHLPSLPDVDRVPVGTRGGYVLFVRLDSDADVDPKGHDRLFARAAFESQLTKARQILASPRPASQYRVLLLHHSPANPDYVLGMSARMRAKLEKFLDDTDIRVVLTGHMHEPEWSQFTAGTTPCLEARCGTTTQRDTFAASWFPRTAPMNTLLVHRLFEVTPSGAVAWEVETYVRTKKGFVPHTDPRYAPRRITIWP
jgi:3',5'-cyclic AMP phosphodiesterase CpdA